VAGKVTTGLAREGRLSLSVVGSANVLLTEAQAENGVLEFTGALTGSINVSIPDAIAASGTDWLVYNNTSGAFTLTIKPVSGSGVVVEQGRKAEVYVEGANIVSGVNDLSLVDLNALGGYRQTVDGWWADDVPGTAGPTLMSRFTGLGAAFPTSWVAVRVGSITGVVVKSNAARTAGTLTVEVFKNGAGIGLTAVLDATNTLTKSSTQAKDTDTFVAGDELDCRVTSAGWTPTTADIRASIEVET
jgi:hypothetical protein